MPSENRLDLVAENAELRAKLAEAKDTLRAIRRGEIDPVIKSLSITSFEARSRPRVS